jgi:hypothetical protein
MVPPPSPPVLRGGGVEDFCCAVTLLVNSQRPLKAADGAAFKGSPRKDEKIPCDCVNLYILFLYTKIKIKIKTSYVWLCLKGLMLKKYSYQVLTGRLFMAPLVTTKLLGIRFKTVGKIFENFDSVFLYFFVIFVLFGKYDRNRSEYGWASIPFIFELAEKIQ